MARVLIVDDEVKIRGNLGRGLKGEGFEVVTAADGPSGLHAALNSTFDAILLDIAIPGLSGYRVLKRLRAEGVDAPVLLISTKDGEVDQAVGLNLGADGYLVKPFSFLVLVAQVRALLRRREMNRPEPAPRHVGDLIVDPTGTRASYAGCSMTLSPREFALLHALVCRPDTVVSRTELLQLVWGGTEAASANVVEVYVGYLRCKLRAAGAGDLLRTVRGRGYLMPTDTGRPPTPDKSPTRSARATTQPSTAPRSRSW
jgi:DNA-binding response OmpR family regulator